MRPAPILSLAVLAALTACSSTSGDWRAIQRDRIDQLHRGRTPMLALREVLRAAPGTVALADEEAPMPAPEPVAIAQRVPQDHLDQRLPPVEGQGPRPFGHRWQPLTVTVDVGVGTASADVSGSRLDDRADAAMARVRVDSGPGGALHAEMWSSDENAFAGTFVNDGVTPAVANAELSGFDVFPHIRFDEQLGDVRVPVRLGMFGDWQQIDHQRARVERDFISFGPRVVAEPTWRLLDDDDRRIELYGRAGVDVGAAWFAEEFRNGSSHDTTIRWGGELGAGVRGTFGRLHAELGYRLNSTWFGGLEGDLYGDPSTTQLERQQLFLGFGLTY